MGKGIFREYSWKQSDAFHAAYQQDAPVEYGLFDFSRLENR